MKERLVTAAARWAHRLQRWRLRWERLRDRGRPGPRVFATACWNFPVYSQTFVYQELTHLLRSGARLRFVYSKLESREDLPAQSADLWPCRFRLVLHPRVGEDDVTWFERRYPDRVASLNRLLEEESGLSPQALRAHRHYRQAFSFARLAEAWGPDYLHSYFFYEGTFFALVASHLLQVPRGVSAYADHVLEDYDLKLMPLHLRQASLFIATSNRIKEELLGLGPCETPERILVKPNAVDARRFTAPDRAAAGDGPVRVVAVSRIDPKKGLTYLARATGLLVARGVPVEVDLVGAADDNEAGRTSARELEAAVEAGGAGAAFRQVGRRTHEEVRAMLRRADVWVSSAVETDDGDKDGIPTALLEAMASGLAIVTTDAGSIPEVVEHEVDALVVPQRDAEALAAAIDRLHADPALARRLGEAAVRKVRSRFDVEVCEARFHLRLAEILEARAGAPPA